MSKKNFDTTAQRKAAISMLKEAEQGVANANKEIERYTVKVPHPMGISLKKFVDAGSVGNAGTPECVTAEKLQK